MAKSRIEHGILTPPVYCGDPECSLCEDRAKRESKNIPDKERQPDGNASTEPSNQVEKL